MCSFANITADSPAVSDVYGVIVFPLILQYCKGVLQSKRVLPEAYILTIDMPNNKLKARLLH